MAPRTLPLALREALAAETGATGAGFAGLCGELLASRGASPVLDAALADAAAGRTGESWEERRLAVLMLQVRALRALERGDGAEMDKLLAGFGVPPLTGLRSRLAASRRARAWTDFLAAARCECRLPLARWFFSPAEVVARVRSQVRTSRGVPDPLPDGPAREARRALGAMPAYEAEICRLLIADATLYWVSDDTPSHFGALVAQPPGTVVLVVRPPGSDLEIEIKRAGRRGPQPLGAAFSRAGRDVPPSHRLDGGSMGPLLQWEARSAARLAGLYRRMHGEEAPVSRALAIASVYTVPGAAGEAHVLDYFTDPEAFGPGFAAMRRDMGRAVAAWRREGCDGVEVAGDLGLTLGFLHAAAPRQAVLVGTSALRLDLAARWLAADGAADCFAAQGREPGPGEARRFTDDLLEEVLGAPAPPACPCTSHAAQVDAAFAAHRRRADRFFLDLSRRLGRLWGTVAAAGAGSYGESFVARNVGLAGCWREGRRTVELVSMDHDRLTFPESGSAPGAGLATARALDERYVLGSFESLTEIYRADSALARRGREALMAERSIAETRRETP